MKKSGLADSPFFPTPRPESKPRAVTPLVERRSKQKNPLTTTRKPKPRRDSSASSRYRDTTAPRHHETTVSRYHDTTVEVIRKAVKQIGKEAATHRFTEEEKKAIASIIFTYKNQGVITSENEVTRIAINFVIKDFEKNGENGILAKCIKALND